MTALATASLAAAAPILFDNADGTFPWQPGYFLIQGGPTHGEDGSPGAQELDLTRPATQSGAPGDPFQPGDDHRFNYLKVVSFDPKIGGIYTADLLGHGLDSRIAIGQFFLFDTITGPEGLWLPKPFQAGQVVGPGEDYADQISPALSVSSSVMGQAFPIGEDFFVGVRFTLLHDRGEPTTHYGWIHMVATTFNVKGRTFFDRFVATQWAYETAPDTPIVVDPTLPPSCQADLTGDALVNGLDLAVLLGAWGASGPADLDDSGIVNGIDLALLLGQFGEVCQ